MKQQQADEYVAMLKYRLSSKMLPSSLTSLDQTFAETNPFFDKHRAMNKNVQVMLASRRQKLIGQFKLDLMAVDISKAEAMAHGHARMARELKENLLSTGVEGVDNIVNAIQARQTNIIQRAQYVQHCKMSFFDETPTLIN